MLILVWDPGQNTGGPCGSYRCRKKTIIELRVYSIGTRGKRHVKWSGCRC